MPGYSDPGFDTLALHAGAAPDPATGARAVPIHLTTSFVFEQQRPRRGAVQPGALGPRLLAHLATRPTPCSSSASRRSKAASAPSPRPAARRRCTWRSRRSMGAGSHIVASTRALRRLAQPAALHAARASASRRPSSSRGDLDGWRAAIRPEDAAAVRRDARQPRPRRARHPARRRDRARARAAAAGRLDLHHALPDAARSSYGADLVYHSATKFLSGHGTVIGGVLVDGGSFDWERLRARFAELTAPYDGFHDMVFSEESTVGAFLLRARREGLRDFGACMSPHTAWLILQGIETLPLRMERHVEQHAQGGRVPRRASDGRARRLSRCSSRIPSHALAQAAAAARARARCSAST